MMLDPTETSSLLAAIRSSDNEAVKNVLTNAQGLFSALFLFPFFFRGISDALLQAFASMR